MELSWVFIPRKPGCLEPRGKKSDCVEVRREFGDRPFVWGLVIEFGSRMFSYEKWKIAAGLPWGHATVRCTVGCVKNGFESPVPHCAWHDLHLGNLTGVLHHVLCLPTPPPALVHRNRTGVVKASWRGALAVTSEVSTLSLGPHLSPDTFPCAPDPACLHFLTNISV